MARESMRHYAALWAYDVPNRENYYANKPGIEEKYYTNWCKLKNVINNTHWRSGFGWGTAWHLRRRDSMRAVIKRIFTNKTNLSKAATLGRHYIAGHYN